jgi:hypothetical protein
MAGAERLDGLIQALAAGQTVAAAARLAGLSERTAYRRLGDPAVQAQVRTARADLFARVVGQLTGSLTAAVDTLVRNLDADQPSVQVRAAVALLDHAVKLRDSEELERRVAALELLLDPPPASAAPATAR